MYFDSTDTDCPARQLHFYIPLLKLRLDVEKFPRAVRLDISWNLIVAIFGMMYILQFTVQFTIGRREVLTSSPIG